MFGLFLVLNGTKNKTCTFSSVWIEQQPSKLTVIGSNPIKCYFVFLIMVNTILFYFFSMLCLLSAFLVITVKNPIYSALFLVLTFINSAGLVFLLETEFISLMFIIVYVGAIAVLFLFVIMMLDIKLVNFKRDLMKYFPVGLLLSLIFLFEVASFFIQNLEFNPYEFSSLKNSYSSWYVKLDSVSNVETIGQVLYTTYLLEFLIGGLILLLSVICAVVLTNLVKFNKKKQIISKQVVRKYV